MEESNVNVSPTPIQPAQPKKGKAGLIIGIGCAVVALIGIIIAIIVLVVIVLVAGGSSKMKCTYEQSTSGCKIVSTADIGFKGNNVKTVDFDGYVDCTGAAYESYILDALETQLKGTDNVIDVKRSGSKITFKYKDAAGIKINDINNSKVGISKAEAKEKLTNAGYKCE